MQYCNYTKSTCQDTVHQNTCLYKGLDKVDNIVRRCLRIALGGCTLLQSWLIDDVSKVKGYSSTAV